MGTPQISLDQAVLGFFLCVGGVEMLRGFGEEGGL